VSGALVARRPTPDARRPTPDHTTNHRLTHMRDLRSAPAMYPEPLLVPMRQELTRLGVEELRSASDVDAKLKETAGTTLVVVNSVCGCSARMARPAVRIALENPLKPENLTTVFAGQDAEATERARSYFVGYAPSSPSITLMKDGKLVFMLERFQIEGRPAEEIAHDLVNAFNKYCQ
jgi:putative YphP/YqiW family bacilliredoxin